MQRGDLVTVSLQGDYGKPRPALIVQSDLLTDLESVVLCPVTSDLRNAAFRVTVEPNPANGLRALSQVMVDKLSTLPRTKISEPFGRLDDERMKAIDRALLCWSLALFDPVPEKSGIPAYSVSRRNFRRFRLKSVRCSIGAGMAAHAPPCPSNDH
jgi:mRNA interferase MazF